MRQEGETMEILEEEGTDDVVPGLAQISCQGWYAPPRPFSNKYIGTCREPA